MIYNLYVISAEIDGKKRYKIGYTRRPVDDRLKELRTGNSADLIVEMVVESKWGTKIEAQLHKHYSHLKINGEWFNLKEEDLDKIKEFCYLSHDNLNNYANYL
jgi:predicted DNA-binding ArsR family transcriptional regulator